MNKSDLIRAMSEKSGLTIKDASAALDAFIDAATEALSKGDDVQLVGFGSFVVSQQAARTARNFKTGETIQVPASKSVKFKCGKNLKESVNV